MGFPKWKYHRTEKAKIVANEAEEAALGEGWEETPAAFESAGSRVVVVEDELKPIDETKEISEPIDLEVMKVTELRALALLKGIEGAEKMKKAELLAALKG